MSATGSRSETRGSANTRGAAPLGLPHTLSRAPRAGALRSRGSLARLLAMQVQLDFEIASRTIDVSCALIRCRTCRSNWEH